MVALRQVHSFGARPVSCFPANTASRRTSALRKPQQHSLKKVLFDSARKRVSRGRSLARGVWTTALTALSRVQIKVYLRLGNTWVYFLHRVLLSRLRPLVQAAPLRECEYIYIYITVAVCVYACKIHCDKRGRSQNEISVTVCVFGFRGSRRPSTTVFVSAR